jgi:hypothetical protein
MLNVVMLDVIMMSVVVPSEMATRHTEIQPNNTQHNENPAEKR